MQSKKNSILEVFLSTAIGFIVSLILTQYVLPLYNFNVTYTQNIQITIIYTVVSILRGYFVRRLFNHIYIREYIVNKGGSNDV